MDMKNLDYEKLKNCISNRMPAEYLAGSIVEEKHYDYPFSNWELNFNPYKRGGRILPVRFGYYDKDVMRCYHMPKGYDWLPKYFMAMAKYNETHLLPVAFIAIFTRHLIKSYIESSIGYIPNTFNSYELLKLSEDELKTNDYGVPDFRCKDFLDTGSREADKAGISDLIRGLGKNDNTFTEDVLADIIVKCVKFMTDNYHMVYWSYPDEEYDRARQMYKDAANSLGERILRDAGVI